MFINSPNPFIRLPLLCHQTVDAPGGATPGKTAPAPTAPAAKPGDADAPPATEDGDADPSATEDGEPNDADNDDPAKPKGKPKLHSLTDEQLGETITAAIKRHDSQKARSEAATKAAAAKKAAEEAGDLQQILDAERLEATNLREELEQLRGEVKTGQRSTVAVKHGLPEALAKLLQGDTPEELEKHALELKALIKTPPAPPVEGGGAKPPATDKKPAATTNVDTEQFGFNQGKQVAW